MATDRLAQLINKLNKSWQRDAIKAMLYLQKLIAGGMKLETAVRKVERRYPKLFTLPELQPALVEAAAYAYGIVPALLTSAEVKQIGKQLAEAWDAGGMDLSEKLHGAEQKMRDAIISTVREQMRKNSTWQQAARALYDGYADGKNDYTGGVDIIRKQEMAKYMQSVRHAIGDSPLALREQMRAAERINALARRGAPNKSLQAAYNELLQKVQQGKEKQLARAVEVAINEKSRYVAERITRTEMARAWADGFWANVQNDDDVVAVKYKLSSRHPVFDICDMYAKADMFGLGAGIFPKDKAPALPIHPHCLCRYAEVIYGEIDLHQKREQVRSAGDKWLNDLPEAQRAQVLGIKGAEEWKNGGDWREYMRGYAGFRENKSRLADIQGRGRKTEITQKTIDDLGEFAFPGFTRQENQIMQERYKDLLAYARDKNNSNEVAFILDRQLNIKNIIKGSEEEVSFTMPVGKDVYILHNHPHGETFSFNDIYTLLNNDTVRCISLITNKGHIEVLQKPVDYDKIKIGHSKGIFMKKIKGEIGLSKMEVAERFLDSISKEGLLLWKK